ncbi:prenyltransferase/squalene oxidase repeat-containing protein [Candidatus Uabimicrobium sp. HlEnr_7]|uniref:prenyltransferase/squalene oxidase repeat-containing protein n=1 Tax=Candidatus Uabimicrobium helgolandensis TaxID=3095367 RepID=UPI0035561156
MKILNFVLVLIATQFCYSETFTSNLLTPGTVNAVERGLNYLAKVQDEKTGAWLNHVGYKLNYDYRIDNKDAPHVGVTSLACLAFMSAGNLPGRGRYGENVRKGLDFVLGCVHEHTGYISKYGTRMYSHAFATLFLAQVYGMTNDPIVGAKLQKSIDLISDCQNAEGGWRYMPIAMDADMSVTVCQVQALRAARNVGLKVSKGTIQKALRYIRRSADSLSGGFKYQDLPIRQSRITFAVTAAGLTSMYGAGVYEDYLLKKGLNYLRNPPAYEPHPSSDHYFFYYGHYYAAQAMFIAGEPYWSRWYRNIRNELVRVQQGSGAWEDATGYSCPTALSVIILQLPNRYLPIFQK